MEWAEVINNPMLRNLPFKIELNHFGQILMSPASNHHGRIQGRLAANLINHLPQGEVITECSVQTSRGVKVADVAWASDQFIETFVYTTPYPQAPEICIEIVSPSNTWQEMQEKIELYLACGAQEVWIIDTQQRIKTFNHTGQIEQSSLAANAQQW